MALDVPAGAGLQAALARASVLRLGAGTHYIDRPLVIRKAGVQITGASPGETIISGGLRLAAWRPYPGSENATVWSTELPPDASPRQLWVGGRRAIPARSPNAASHQYLYWHAALPEPFSRWGLVYEAAQGLESADLVGAQATVFWSWTASQHRVVSHDPSTRTLVFDRPSRQPLGHHLPQSSRRFLLEFAGALDAPNEFATISNEGAGNGRLLLYRPPEGVDDPNALGSSMVARRGLTTLMRIEGRGSATLSDEDEDGGEDDDNDGHEDGLVSGVHIANLTLAHVDWVLPGDPTHAGDDEGHMHMAEDAEGRMADWQAAAFLTDAALVVRHATRTRATNVRVCHVGGYAVWLADGARHSRLENTSLSDMGAGGVRIGAMELSGHEQRNGGRPAAAHNAIVQSRILSGGHVFREGVGILAHRTQGTLIENNEIAHLGYTGISLGWEWGYARPSGGGFSVVRGNFVHHIGRHELSDMGGIYVLGHAEGTIIEHNTFAYVAPYRMYGWGIYLDEGASGVIARGNLVLRTRSASFHQHFGSNNSIVNNVFACAGDADGDLALSIGEAHLSFTLRRNIVLRCPTDWMDDASTGAPHSAEAEDATPLQAAAVTPTGEVASIDTTIASDAPHPAAAAPFPLVPAWLFWWKGEGSKPEVDVDENVYFSLDPLEQRLGPPPPSLHFAKRGRTLRGWQKQGQDQGSLWADPDFRNAQRCDFSLGPESLAVRRGFQPLVTPIMAQGQPAGGGSGGCGAPTPPGRSRPPPEPLDPPSLPAEERPTLQALSRMAPNGTLMLKQHRKEVKRLERERRAQLEAQEEAFASMRYAAQRHLSAYGTPCWVEGQARNAKYLPGCTQDGCVEHASLEEAAAVCELMGDECGGITADPTRNSYQTRVGPGLRSGPREEQSWRKAPCS